MNTHAVEILRMALLCRQTSGTTSTPAIIQAASQRMGAHIFSRSITT